MKNKLITTLMLSGLISIILVGCNSGANGVVDNTGTNNQEGILEVETVKAVPIPNIINMAGDDVLELMLDPETGAISIGSQLLSLATVGLFPSNLSASSDQYRKLLTDQKYTMNVLNTVESQILNIQSTLEQNNFMLEQIQNSIYSTATQSDNTIYSTYYSNLKNSLDQFLAFSMQAIPNNEMESNFLSVYLDNESGTMSESLSTYLSQQNTTNLVYEKIGNINSGVDLAEQYLAGEDGLGGIQYNYQESTGYYVSILQQSNSNSTGLNHNSLIYQMLSNGLQAAISQLPLITGKDNYFLLQLQWDNAVDQLILSSISLLNQAYHFDQIRLYMSYGYKSSISAPLSINPVDIENYNNALNDLALAYKVRISYLSWLDTYFKSQLWANVISQINTPSVMQNCALSNQTLESIPLENANSINTGFGYFDGQQLNLSCHSSTNQNSPSVMNNINLNTACILTGGSYNPVVTSAGTISCGPPNYNWTNINNPNLNVNGLGYIDTNNPPAFIQMVVPPVYGGGNPWTSGGWVDWMSAPPSSAGGGTYVSSPTGFDGYMCNPTSTIESSSPIIKTPCQIAGAGANQFQNPFYSGPSPASSDPYLGNRIVLSGQNPASIYYVNPNVYNALDIGCTYMDAMSENVVGYNPNNPANPGSPFYQGADVVMISGHSFEMRVDDTHLVVSCLPGDNNCHSGTNTLFSNWQLLFNDQNQIDPFNKANQNAPVTSTNLLYFTDANAPGQVAELYAQVNSLVVQPYPQFPNVYAATTVFNLVFIGGANAQTSFSIGNGDTYNYGVFASSGN